MLGTRIHLKKLVVAAIIALSAVFLVIFSVTFVGSLHLDIWGLDVKLLISGVGIQGKSRGVKVSQNYFPSGVVSKSDIFNRRFAKNNYRDCGTIINF